MTFLAGGEMMRGLNIDAIGDSSSYGCENTGDNPGYCVHPCNLVLSSSLNDKTFQ